MTTTALTVADREIRDLLADNPNALAPLGLDMLEPEDLRIFPARIKIAHEDDPTIGTGGVKVGQFYNAKTNEVYGDSITFTLLHFARKTRAEYEEPYRKDAPLICGSDDSKSPRESTERRPLTSPQPGPCQTCDRASWKNPDGTDRQKPFCSEQHNFMLNVTTATDTWDAVLLTLQKSRASVAADLRRLCLGGQSRRLLFATTKFVKGDSGNYYVPVFTYGAKLTSEQLSDTLIMARGAYEQYKAGEIFVGADEGDHGNGGDSITPTAEETHMPWDKDPDVAPTPSGEEVAPAQQTASNQPPMPEPPPSSSQF